MTALLWRQVTAGAEDASLAECTGKQQSILSGSLVLLMCLALKEEIRQHLPASGHPSQEDRDRLAPQGVSGVSETSPSAGKPRQTESLVISQETSGEEQSQRVHSFSTVK